MFSEPLDEVHGPLYDTYAGRLHAYCWSLLGEDAPGALHETFVTATRNGPPHRDTLVWLYGLARTECVRRGALDRGFETRDADPLRRAAGRLRADHREVLVLSAGGWLEEPEIAQLLGIATDTTRQLIRTAHKRLERAVIDTLLPGPVLPEYDDVLAAFEGGTLDRLFAQRAPIRPPPELRSQVLAACLEQSPLPFPGTTPLVVIDPRVGRPVRRRGRRLAVVGVAAMAAAAAGVFLTLPASDSVGRNNVLVPTAAGSTQDSNTIAAGLPSKILPVSPQQSLASPSSSRSVPLTAHPDRAPKPPPGVLPPPAPIPIPTSIPSVTPSFTPSPSITPTPAPSSVTPSVTPTPSPSATTSP
ncbi:MAG: polymerase, sigma-24 subunit, subfamily [Actinomycetia bacterium]|nr:polymerase, sigma-24 subunit, subfamily [Actinomycetes bacterium]